MFSLWIPVAVVLMIFVGVAVINARKGKQERRARVARHEIGDEERDALPMGEIGQGTRDSFPHLPSGMDNDHPEDPAP